MGRGEVCMGSRCVWGGGGGGRGEVACMGNGVGVCGE